MLTRWVFVVTFGFGGGFDLLFVGYVCFVGDNCVGLLVLVALVFGFAGMIFWWFELVNSVVVYLVQHFLC